MCARAETTILEWCAHTLMRTYCHWKRFWTTWLAGAPSQRVQQFILRPRLQNLFDTIFNQSFTDPYQKWKDPQNVVGVAEGHPHHILGAWPKAMPLSFLVGVCETLYKNCIKQILKTWPEYEFLHPVAGCTSQPGGAKTLPSTVRMIIIELQGDYDASTLAKVTWKQSEVLKYITTKNIATNM